MLRVIHVGNSLPYFVPCDPSATFQPGQILGLTVQGNSVLGTVSNGSAPLGIIDDIKTKAFSAVSWDETIIVPAVGVIGGDGRLVTTADIKAELLNANIFPDSFVSIPVSVQLIPRNGVIVFPIGTELNFDRTGAGTFNAIKTNVRYSYQIPNIIGDDSTLGSNRVTFWYGRGFYQTDMFDATASYPVNAPLFVSEKGMLTTKAVVPNYPSVAIVTNPPSPLSAMMEFIWL